MVLHTISSNGYIQKESLSLEDMKKNMHHRITPTSDVFLETRIAELEKQLARITRRMAMFDALFPDDIDKEKK